MLLCKYILWIFFYSIIGWAYESILCSVLDRRIVNRGFLNGPYCPIYGFGAALDIFVLHDLNNIISLFYLGAVLACTLEYSTSWLMEKLFQSRWWDYSSHRYNINGRISLAGAVVFGIFSVLLVRFIHPEIANITSTVPDSRLLAITCVLLLILAVDSIVTIKHVLRFNRRIRLVDMRLQFSEIKDQLLEIKDQLSEIRSLIKKLNVQEIRILRAFPKLKSLFHNDALMLIKEAFSSSIWKAK